MSVITDLEEMVRIPALNRYVTNTALSTTIGRNGVKIATIEHLMAAIWGMGIDNLKIEVSGPEIPKDQVPCEPDIFHCVR